MLYSLAPSEGITHAQFNEQRESGSQELHTLLVNSERCYKLQQLRYTRLHPPHTRSVISTSAIRYAISSYTASRSSTNSQGSDECPVA